MTSWVSSEGVEEVKNKKCNDKGSKQRTSHNLRQKPGSIHMLSDHKMICWFTSCYQRGPTISFGYFPEHSEVILFSIHNDNGIPSSDHHQTALRRYLGEIHNVSNLYNWISNGQ
ncbi:hypothetical protein Tco_0340860 [Tanacetum coccineum]